MSIPSFLYGTLFRIARPSGFLVQKATYNGHKRVHALKFQTLVAPDGLALHVAGPYEGRRHDLTIWRWSELDAELQTKLMIDGVQFYIYGDSAYLEKPWCRIPMLGTELTEMQRQLNTEQSRVRISVEWFYSEVNKYWTRCVYKRTLRLHAAPVGLMYKAALLLTNFRSCIYPNEISRFFKVTPPTLEDYLVHKQN